MYLTDRVIQKYNLYYKDTNECIEYPVLNDSGYPCYQQKINNINCHFTLHRVSYQIYYNDDINVNDIICHKCDNKKCINPKHLFKGTHNDNVQDKVLKGRQDKGETNGRYIHGYNSKYSPTKKPTPEYTSLFSRSLTKELSEELKSIIKNRGNKKLKTISEEYNIPYQIIRDISCGRTYKNK